MDGNGATKPCVRPLFLVVSRRVVQQRQVGGRWTGCRRLSGSITYGAQAVNFRQATSAPASSSWARMIWTFALLMTASTEDFAATSAQPG